MARARCSRRRERIFAVLRVTRAFIRVPCGVVPAWLVPRCDTSLPGPPSARSGRSSPFAHLRFLIPCSLIRASFSATPGRSTQGSVWPPDPPRATGPTPTADHPGSKNRASRGGGETVAGFPRNASDPRGSGTDSELLPGTPAREEHPRRSPSGTTGAGNRRPTGSHEGVFRPRRLPERHGNVARGEGARDEASRSRAGHRQPAAGADVERPNAQRNVLAGFCARRTGPELVVLHDSEDIIDPRTFQVYAAYAADHDFIQVPVFSLNRDKGAHVASTYMDEFAERHTREMIVRDAVGAAMIPSAGVGTCMTKRLIRHFLSERGQVLMSGTVTEDYILGIEAKRAGFKSAFAAVSANADEGLDFVATREFFPKTVNASITQKTRWVYGITFEAMHKLGWEGSLWDRYFFIHDRKGMIANFLPRGLLRAARTSASLATSTLPTYRTSLEPILSASLCGNLVALVARYLIRVAACRQVYGTYDWIGVAVRWPVSLYINMAAVVPRLEDLSRRIRTRDEGNRLVEDRSRVARRHAEPWVANHCRGKQPCAFSWRAVRARRSSSSVRCARPSAGRRGARRILVRPARRIGRGAARALRRYRYQQRLRCRAGARSCGQVRPDDLVRSKTC